jgi:hypothetical protein
MDMERRGESRGHSNGRALSGLLGVSSATDIRTRPRRHVSHRWGTQSLTDVAHERPTSPAWWSRHAAPPRVPVRLLRGGEPGFTATWRVPRGEMAPRSRTSDAGPPALLPPSAAPEARYLIGQGPELSCSVPPLDLFFCLAPHRRREKERKRSDLASAPTGAFQSTDARAPPCLTTATGTGNAAAGAPTSSRSSTPPWRSRTWPESAPAANNSDLRFACNSFLPA